MNKSYYFAGSITGGRDDAALYLSIIDIIKQHGTVLTEHIGSSALTAAGETTDPKFIHDRDVEWLFAADATIAEVTTISIGVGYELGRMVEYNLKADPDKIKPVLCLYRPSVRQKLSAMIAGAPGLTIAPYETLEEAQKLIEDFIQKNNL